MYRLSSVGLAPTLFIILIATLGLLAGEAEAALYLSVTAFALAVGPTALRFREGDASDKVRRTLVLAGVDYERVEEILDRPAMWAIYSFTLFVLSGFAFLAFYLIPTKLLGAEQQPLFVGSLSLYALGFAYLGITFAAIVFTRSASVFRAANSLSRSFRLGSALVTVQWTIGFELAPATILVVSLLAGFSGLKPFGYILNASTVLSLVGLVVIEWALADYLRRKKRRFSDRTLAISVFFYLLPFLAFAVFYLL